MQQMQPIDPKGSFLKNLILSLVLIGLSSFLIPARIFPNTGPDSR